jgi:endonuclease/exonuclease/phosphatase (EEP) superfamily protein YafD
LFLSEHPESTGTERDPLKVATFNINNINKRLDNLLAWLAKAEPDVVSLQELKAEQEAFRGMWQRFTVRANRREPQSRRQ